MAKKNQTPSKASKLKLISKDDKVIQLPAEALKICRIFDDFEGEERYEIRQVHSEQLSVVAAFLILHKEEKLKPFSIQNRENETLNSVVTQSKYQRFVNEHFREMTNVVKVRKAADYMCIQPLLELTGIVMAIGMQGKTEQEIRAMLNYPPVSSVDKTSGNRWLFEK